MPSRRWHLLVAAVHTAALRAHATYRGGALSDSLPFYHSSDQLREAVGTLAKSCAGASLSVDSVAASGAGGNVSVDVVTLRPRGGQGPGSGPSFLQQRARASDRGPLRAMVVFGEHPRELISAESGLHLLQTLCSAGGNGGAGAASGLPGGLAELKVVVNANPIGRREVEAGEWCRRTNEDRVDLNRNWGEGFDSKTESQETNPGPESFSEPETQILRDVASKLQPQLFLTVHSGALLLGTPYGKEQSTPSGGDEERMVRVLRPISEKYCNCPFGSLAQVIGYKSPGNSIDYAYEDLGIPFAFTWEIYATKELTDYYHWSRKTQQQQEAQGGPGGSVGQAPTDQEDLLAWSFGQAQDDFAASVHRLSAQSRAAGDGSVALVETGAAARAVMRHRGELAGLDTAADRSTAEDCLMKFNPTSQAEYATVLQKWTSAYLELLGSVAGEIA